MVILMQDDFFCKGYNRKKVKAQAIFSNKLNLKI